MPIISRFYGVIIKMFYNEGNHHLPHFHAEYGGEKAVFLIDPSKRFKGKLKKRAEAMILEWAELHREKLIDNYENARQKKPLNKIRPLDD